MCPRARGRSTYSSLRYVNDALVGGKFFKRGALLEKRGVITGYRAEINPAAVGLHLHAFVQVTIDSAQHAPFEEAVGRHASVIQCFATAGDDDYLLQILVPGIDELDTLLRAELSRLPGVQRISTTVCVKSIKKRAAIVECLRWFRRLTVTVLHPFWRHQPVSIAWISPIRRPCSHPPAAAAPCGPTDIALTFADYIGEQNRRALRYQQLNEETLRFVEELERISAVSVSLISTAYDQRNFNSGGDVPHQNQAAAL